MLNTIIIDDEVLFCNSFAHCIVWETYGFTIIGQAHNGQEAIRLLESNRVDVAFCDINMPVMDGIEFMKYLSIHYPNIIVIMLSCHSDFDYVKETFKLGIFDYILKASFRPTDIPPLLEIIRKRYQELDSQWYKDTTSFLSNHLFTVPDGEQSLSAYDFRRKQFRLFNLKITFLNRLVDKYKSYQRIADSLHTVPFMDENGTIYLLACGKAKICMVVLSDNFSRLSTMDNINQWIAHLNDQILKDTGAVCHAISSDVYDDFSQMQKVFLSLEEKSYQSFYGKTEHFEAYSEKNSSIPATHVDALLDQIENHNKEKCQAMVHNAFNEFRIERLKPESVKANAQYILSKVQVMLSAKKINSWSSSTVNIHYDIESIYDIETMEQYCLDFINRAISAVQAQPATSYRNDIATILNYIDANISQNLSVRDLSMFIGFEEKYFCKLFKKETGQSCKQYILSKKMAVAKDALRHSNKKITDIAYDLGFQDDAYFSKVFKNEVGTTPAKYRKN